MPKLLLFFVLLICAGPAMAQNKLKANDPDARLRSLSRPTKRVNDKATFRKGHNGTGLDLHAHDPHLFKTAKSNRSFTYGKPGKNRESRTGKKKLIKLKGGARRRGNRTTG